MDPSAWAAWCGVALAFLSLLIHLLQGRRANDLQEQQTKLQKRLTELELAAHEDLEEARTKADLRVSATGLNGVVIENHGMGRAKHVKIEMECPDGSSPLPENIYNRHLPVRLIEPGGTARIPVGFHNQCAPPLEADLEWVDEDGKRRHKTVWVTR